MKKFRQRMLTNGVAMALVISSLTTIPAAAASNTDFKDVKNHWAENEIKNFLQKGYINGYGDNTFKPDNSITRAEFIKIVNMAFGFSEKGTENFTDVRQGDWFYDEVLKAIKQGYIDGYGDNTFRPDDKISREEACKIVGVILKSDGYGDTKFKDDNQIESWAKKYVKGLVDMGIIKGFEDNTFRPKSDASRAETVTAVKGSIEYQSPGNGGGSGSQVNLNPVVTTQQEVNNLGTSIQYTSVTVNASGEIKLTGIKATTMNINSGDVTLENCTIGTLNIGGITRTRSAMAIKVNVIGSTKLEVVNINSAAVIDVEKGISVNNLVVGQNAGGTEIKGDGEIVNGEVNSDIKSEIEFNNSGSGKVELVVVLSNLNVSTEGNNVTVTAVAKNYEANKAKVELISDGEPKAIEIEIGDNGAIAHTFEGVANGKYTAKVTVGSTSTSSEEFDVNVEQVDKLSEYGFEFIMDESVIEGAEYKVDMGLKATTVNQLGYTNALVKVRVTTPEGGAVQLLATDTNNKEWDIAKIGQWGPSQGFAISNDYNATTPVKARFSTVGNYTIKLTLVDVLNGNNVIASKDIHVNVVANIPDTVLTKSSELVDGKVSLDMPSN